jgi:hypothetical protein
VQEKALQILVRGQNGFRRGEQFDEHLGALTWIFALMANIVATIGQQGNFGGNKFRRNLSK